MLIEIQKKSFWNEQIKYDRVKKAYDEKKEKIAKNLTKFDLKSNDLNILLVAFKDEDIFEIYGKSKISKAYKKIDEYLICNKSGNLGPKRKAGDYQVPEGFYQIDRFNPASNYHLSLGLNYPNESDRIKSKADDLGGDIFIHGECVTIGCLPMTNEKIKEIYLYAVYAKNSGQSKVPVYIFPFKMNDENFKNISKYTKNKPLIDFWKNLKVGFDNFEKNKQALKFKINNDGGYEFN